MKSMRRHSVCERSSSPVGHREWRASQEIGSHAHVSGDCFAPAKGDGAGIAVHDGPPCAMLGSDPPTASRASWEPHVTPTVADLRPLLLRRAIRLEWLTIGWNIVEGIVAVGAGLLARSIALVGFGVDSAVETVSGVILLWRLSAEARGTLDVEAVERVEHRAERLVGVAFMLLAAYVAFEAVRSLVGQEAPDASPVGIGLTGLSIVVMLWLARRKRITGEALDSRALVADAQQTYACWYLSVITLAGLVLNAAFGWWWADPVAALGIVVLLVREGLEALRGEDRD
jgi:Cation efflux family